jgi:hypothetical protein
LRFQTDDGRKTVVTSYTDNPRNLLLGETIREGFDGQYFIDGTLHEISLLEIGKVVALTVQVVLPKVDRSHIKKVRTG